jgi:hypothetical protein
MYTFPETKRVAPPQGASDRPSSRMETFASIIQAEDYVAAASSHRGVLSGAQTHVIFGRNEPALHHYHSVFNAALGLESIETYDG